MRGLFVTGTDTGVGKTVVSAALLARFPAARYWKPVQTGMENDDDTAEVLRLSGRTAEACRAAGIRLKGAVSPHLAARRAGMHIDPGALAEGAAAEEGVWIVEGAGGVLTPLNPSEKIATLMQRLGLPALIVAPNRVGVINHTLLTLESLRARHVPIAAVVLVGNPNPDHLAAIVEFGRVRAAEMPRYAPLSRIVEWEPPPWLEPFLR